MKRNYFIFLAIVLVVSCKSKNIGSIERIDPALDSIISENAKIEIIAKGFNWSEGPVWLKDQKMLIFSDVPKNTIYKWTEEKGLETYLTPSGYTGSVPRGGEPGSNGLLINKDGKLVLCQHGDRRLALMNAVLNDPKSNFISLADNYNGKRFNSPNDLVQRSNGDYFFTDPPYGLLKNMEDSSKEIPFQGVYKVGADKIVKLMVDSLTRPNGIALTPDEKTLVIGNTDSPKLIWYGFDFASNDSLINGRILYDATEAGKSNQGSPDGLKIDKQGNVFASAPGGLWIFNKDFKLLGKIKLPVPVANCALANGDSTLFITADMYVLRVKMR